MSSTGRTSPAGALVSDCGGAVMGLAMALPGTYLAPGHERVRRALGSLIQAFDAGVRVTLLVGTDDQDACTAWLGGLALRCTVSLARVPSGEVLKTLWIQDRFLCRAAPDHGRRTYLVPPSSGRENMAVWLAAFDGSDAEEMRTGLSGGNCLVGENYWLAGAASLEQSFAFLPGDRKNYQGARQSIAAIDGRRLVVVGHSYADLKYRDVEPCRAETTKPPENPSDEGLRQPVFHLDVFLTPTGETMEGKPLLLVAEPVSLDGRAGATEKSYRAPLAAVCRRLAAAGFAILRNPVAVLPARRSGGGPRFWRPYNNVILQNRPEPIVWLPQFCDDEWPELRQLDDDNTRIWRERLGYSVRPIRDWGAVAALGGGLRCVTKVTERGVG
jgi:hypothetical protein